LASPFPDRADHRASLSGRHPGGGALAFHATDSRSLRRHYGDRRTPRPGLVRGWHFRPLIRTRRVIPPGQPRKVRMSASSLARGPRRICRA
jgi:hypothetical protein